MVKVLGHNNDDGASLEMLQLQSDDFASDVGLKPSRKSASPDPFIGSSECLNRRANQPDTETSIPQILKRGHSFKVLTQLDKNTLKLATARELIQRLKGEAQLQTTAHRVPEHKLESVHNQATQQREVKRNIGQICVKEGDSTDTDSGKLSSFICFLVPFILKQVFLAIPSLIKHN